MVGKLLKHELYALFRVLVFFAAAVLLFAVTGRILIFIVASQSNGSEVADAFLIIIVLFYMFAIFALVFGAYALGVNRFYKTLFTGEGYMTLSLPATPVQLIVGKLLSSLIAVFAAFAVSVLSMLIFLVGWNIDVMQMIYQTLGALGETISQLISLDPLSFFENLLGYILEIPMFLLIVFAVISVGQLFNSHRKPITFAILIGVFFVYDIISTALMPQFMNLETYVSVHLANWIKILIYAAIDAGSFFLIRYIIKNKVNLIA